MADTQHTVSARERNARICQEGASNERRVASALVEAIDECRAENVDPREDTATFLILHQLTYLLTGMDMTLLSKCLADRWEAGKSIMYPNEG